MMFPEKATRLLINSAVLSCGFVIYQHVCIYYLHIISIYMTGTIGHEENSGTGYVARRVTHMPLLYVESECSQERNYLPYTFQLTTINCK